MGIGSWRDAGQQPQPRQKPAEPPPGDPVLTGFTDEMAGKMDSNNESLRDIIAVLGGDPAGNKEPTSSSGDAQNSARASSGQSVKVK